MWKKTLAAASFFTEIGLLRCLDGILDEKAGVEKSDAGRVSSL